MGLFRMLFSNICLLCELVTPLPELCERSLSYESLLLLLSPSSEPAFLVKEKVRSRVIKFLEGVSFGEEVGEL